MNAAQLEQLARNGSASSTGALVAALAELFCTAEETERERVSLIFGDIVMRVLDRVESEARCALSSRIAGEANAPKEVLKTLAKDDDLDVALPVLEGSESLDDDDLAAIAEVVSNDHLMALARRSDVQPSLAKVIARKGDAPHLHTLTRNHDAVLCPECFDTLVARARRDETLQEALAERDDMPKPAAARLVSFLSRELTQRVKDLNSNDTLVKAIAEKAAREVEIQLREFKGAKSKTDQLIEGAIAGSVPMDKALTTFADKERAFEIARLLAGRMGWPENVVVPLITREDDLPLMCLCRLSGVTPDAYMKVARMRGKRMRLSSSVASEAMRRYAELTDDKAQAQFTSMAKKLKLPTKLPSRH